MHILVLKINQIIYFVIHFCFLHRLFLSLPLWFWGCSRITELTPGGGRGGGKTKLKIKGKSKRLWILIINDEKIDKISNNNHHKCAGTALQTPTLPSFSLYNPSLVLKVWELRLSLTFPKLHPCPLSQYSV